SLSLKWYEYVFKNKGYTVFTDSILLAAIAAPLTAFLSMVIAYLVVKKNFIGKGLMEFVAMLAMAVPGTVLGVAFIRGFSSGIYYTGILSGLYGTAWIIIIVFIVRSLPVGTRSGIAALRQIDKSIEESAFDLGASGGKVFTTVTLPLIKDSFFSGLVTTFVRSITAISAIILLVTPEYLLITVRINEHAEKGNYGIACAYATILIIITFTAIMLMEIVMNKMSKNKSYKGGE
ncbi:MAG: ABC transporter permease subunit, partial [Erysipelotrichaceae bacterium]